MDKLEEVKQLCIDLLLVPFEGTGPMTPDGRFMAYKDPGSKSGLPITIAWGITFDELGNPIQLGDVWDEARAKRVKELILNKFIASMLALSPDLAQEDPKKIAAVLSFVYNCGIGNYRISTFKKRINEADWEEAARECLKWNKAAGKIMRGLTRRRQAEAQMLLQ